MIARTRIALLITELHPAGAERVVFELATRLDRDRFEVLVCSLTSPGGDDGAIAAALADVEIPVVSVRMRHKLDVFGARRLARAVRDFRPDVLHAHLFHANLAARLLGRRVGVERVVSTIHIVERRPRHLRRILERLSAGRDDRTVCVSEAVCRHAAAELGVRDPVLIPNGIDLGHFRDLPPRDRARADLGLPAGPVIGAVGRLTHQKGCDVLLRAFAALSRGGEAPSLLFAGTGEDAASLRALAEELGVAPRVHFVGFQRDVRTVYAAIDVFCMPSRWEGFGLAMVEALAAGVPVVAADVDSLPEVLGDAGLLVPADQPAELASALRRVLAEPGLAEALRDRGRERAARFGVGRMIANYEALYVELCTAPA